MLLGTSSDLKEELRTDYLTEIYVNIPTCNRCKNICQKIWPAH